MCDILNTTQSEITYDILFVIKVYRMFDIALQTWSAFAQLITPDPNLTLKYPRSLTIRKALKLPAPPKEAKTVVKKEPAKRP